MLKDHKELKNTVFRNELSQIDNIVYKYYFVKLVADKLIAERNVKIKLK